MPISTIFLPAALDPREIQQPLLFPFQTYPPIAFPLQTSPRHVAVRLDILDQALLAHVIVFRPDEAQNQQVERCAIEVSGKGVQDVNLNAALRVFVEGIIAYREDCFIDVAASSGSRRRRDG